MTINDCFISPIAPPSSSSAHLSLSLMMWYNECVDYAVMELTKFTHSPTIPWTIWRGKLVGWLLAGLLAGWLRSRRTPRKVGVFVFVVGWLAIMATAWDWDLEIKFTVVVTVFFVDLPCLLFYLVLSRE